MNMSDEEKAEIVSMFEAILDDDEGVNENAFNEMSDFGRKLNYEPMTELLNHVDATDGRFYLK